jgi:rubrerythrin
MGTSDEESHAGTGVSKSEVGVMQVQNGLRSSAAAVVARENAESVFLAAGHEASGEFRCAECGYGVIVRSLLPACPMCRGLAWVEPARSPFSS